MAEVRAEIDALDRGIVALIADRLRYIEEAAGFKQSCDQVRNETRNADVLMKVETEAPRLGLACAPDHPARIMIWVR